MVLSKSPDKVNPTTVGVISVVPWSMPVAVSKSLVWVPVAVVVLSRAVVVVVVPVVPVMTVVAVSRVRLNGGRCQKTHARHHTQKCFFHGVSPQIRR